jgi:hydrogenase nickel incorporation protein HypA/HybF
MHETALIANLIKKIDQIARANDAKKVIGVKVKLGALSEISPGHFREHFVAESPGTIAEGASLEIEVSDDINDPEALSIVLKDVVVEDE